MSWIESPSESQVFEESGDVVVRQVTASPEISHHPFFFVDAFDAEMRFLLFISHNSGKVQIYIERQDDQTVIQLTEEDSLAEWSIIPAKDGSWIYFISGQTGKRVSTIDGSIEELVNFGNAEMRESGMVGAAMGTTALSSDGRFWAIPVKTGAISRFWLVDMLSGAADVFLERDTIGHPQFCPDDNDLILYAGPLTDRMWVTDRSGNAKRIFKREHDLQWITHEVWRPGHKTVLFVDWPNGVGEIDLTTGEVQKVTDFPVWHGAPHPNGEALVCDTNFPDRGIHILDLTGARSPQFVHEPKASSEGKHWADPFPYNNGPIKVYAPQHTHPHPRFSPDGSQVVFTSDRSGVAQVFVARMKT